MVARKKKVVILDEELTPTVLATKADKKKVSIFSIIWLLFIFAIFIGGVYYLPDISLYVSNYLNPDVDIPSVPNNNGNSNKDDEEGKEEIVKYDLVDGLVINVNDFSLSNFKVEDNKLSVVVTNNSDTILELDEYNYFLTLYNSNNKLLQRLMVKEGVISSKDNLTLTFDLIDSNINYVTFLVIDQNEYPSHVVSASENGNATLVCKKDNETVNYLLSNNKLYAIQDIFEVNNTDENYAILYSSYQALASTYNAIGGVTSNVEVENNIMYFRTLINLNTFVANSLSNKIIYAKDTDAKIMNFELEASGYDCN